jgi:hypothetical protein
MGESSAASNFQTLSTLAECFRSFAGSSLQHHALPMIPEEGRERFIRRECNDSVGERTKPEPEPVLV